MTTWRNRLQVRISDVDASNSIIDLGFFSKLGYATSLMNSAQSDDGTVFSEPWDSSQWDSFLPQDSKFLKQGKQISDPN